MHRVCVLRTLVYEQKMCQNLLLFRPYNAVYFTYFKIIAFALASITCVSRYLVYSALFYVDVLDLILLLCTFRAVFTLTRSYGREPEHRGV